MPCPLPLLLCGLVLVAACHPVPVTETTDSATAPPPPNIIFLLTDDQRWDAVGFMGNDIVRTPHLDSLAARGVVFERAMVTTAICAISRASILSGQYALRHGINDFSTSFTPTAFAQTYPAQLRAAGYFTGFVGKYGIGTLPDSLAEARFDRWYGFNGQGAYEGTDAAGNYRHLTRRMGEESIGFLAEVPEGQPFALSVSFKAPHVQDGDARQFIPNPAYDEWYTDVTIPVPATASPAHFDRLLPFLQTSEARRRWGLRFATPAMYQQMVKNYYRLVTGIDATVGRITAELRRRGLADNTVIVLLGDHGFYLGEHGLAGKWFGHQESIRVPLLYYDPRLPADRRGARVPQIALNIDIAPTLLDLAGVAVPEQMQGRSLLPLVRGEPVRDWREDFYYEHAFDVRSLGVDPAKLWPIPRSEGVVSLDYTYLVYYDEPPPNEELYDLRADPDQTTNLAEQPTAATTLDRMRRRMRALKQSLK